MHRPAFVLLSVVLLAACSRDSFAQSANANLVANKETTDIPVVFHPKTFAIWSGGALVVVEDRVSNSPLVHVVDREGKEISRFFLTIPQGGGFVIGDWSVARGRDGSIAIVGSVDFPEERGSFLAIVASDGSNQKIVRLSPYRPQSVTVAGDGAIWVVGSSHIEPNTMPDRNQDLIRRYDKSGKLLDSFITWESMETEGPNKPALGSVLMASNDRVAWYSRGAHTYMEFSLNGRVITRVKSWNSSVKHPFDWPVLCDDGNVFVGEQMNVFREHAQPDQEIRWGVFMLERETGKWNFTPRKELPLLLGCDGTQIASTTDFGRSITWLASAAH